MPRILSLCLSSLFHCRSVSVLSLVGRRLSITLSLSLVPAQNSVLLFFFYFFLCLSYLVGSSLCYYIPFSFVFYSFLPSFFLSLCLYFLIVALFLFLVFCSFPSFPPRYRRLSLMKNSRISRVPMKSCCRVKLMEEGWSIGPGAFICRYSASHLARRSSLRLRG